MSNTWPSEYTIKTSSNWVTSVPRPKEGDVHAALLARRQQQWDQANAQHQKSLKRVSEIQAQREAEAGAQRQRAEAARQARDQQKLDALTATLKRGYMQAPGATEEAFQAALPELLEDHRRTAAVTSDDAARRAQAGLYRSF